MMNRSTLTCATLTLTTSFTPSLTWMLMWSPLRTLDLMRSSCQCSVKEWSMVQELALVSMTSTPQEYHPQKKLPTESTRCLQFLRQTFCGSTPTVGLRLASTPRWSQLSKPWLLLPSSFAPSLPVPSEWFKKGVGITNPFFFHMIHIWKKKESYGFWLFQ